MNKHLSAIQEGGAQTTCSTPEAFAAVAAGASVVQLASEAAAADMWKDSEKQGAILEAQIHAPADYANLHLGYCDEVHTVDGLHLQRMDFTCQVTGRSCRAIAVSNRWSNGEIHEEPFAVLANPDITDDGPTAWGIDLQNKLHRCLLRDHEKRLTKLGKRAVNALTQRLNPRTTA